MCLRVYSYVQPHAFFLVYLFSILSLLSTIIALTNSSCDKNNAVNWLMYLLVLLLQMRKISQKVNLVAIQKLLFDSRRVLSHLIARLL